MAKISDYILAKNIIEIICREYDCNFVDCGIDFVSPIGVYGFANGNFSFPIPQSPEETLGKTILMLVTGYLNNMPAINGKTIPPTEKDAIVSHAYAIVRDFIISENSDRGVDGECFAMRLDQFPVVWMILKDILCPLFEVELKNMRIIAGHSSIVDGCVYVTEKDIPSSNLSADEFPFLFLNLDIESDAIRSAFVLQKAVEAHLPALVAHNVLRDIFTKPLIRKDLIDFVSMAFPKDEEAANFFAILALFTQYEGLIAPSTFAKTASSKTAQSIADSPWWFMGIIEKMLDPARGPDWTVTKELEPVTRELWEKVERERKKRGLAEVPFEMLLRISSEDYKTNDKKTTQALLGATRVW